MNAKKRWAIIGALFIATVVAAILPESNESAAPSNAALNPVRMSDARQRAITPPTLPLDLLARKESNGKMHNVFAAKSWYVAPPPPKPAPPPPPSAPPVPFSYLGKIEEEAAEVTIFLVRGDRIYAVNVGQVIDHTYRVEGWSGKGLTLIYLPLNIKQTIAIGNDHE